MSCRSKDRANGKSVLSLVLWPKTYWWSVIAPTCLSNNSEHSQCAKAAGPTAPYVVTLCCSVWLVCKLAQTHVLWSPELVWGSTCWGVIQSFHSLGCFLIGAAAPLFRQPISSTRFLASTTVWAAAAFSMWLSLLSFCCQNQWSLFLIFVSLSVYFFIAVKCNLARFHCSFYFVLQNIVVALVLDSPLLVHSSLHFRRHSTQPPIFLHSSAFLFCFKKAWKWITLGSYEGRVI